MTGFGRRNGLILVPVLIAAALALPATAAAQMEGASAPVILHPDVDPAMPVVDGASSTLVRMDTGLSMSVETAGLEPGGAYTVWWSIFNNPTACSGGLCNEDDFLIVDENGAPALDDDGNLQLNFAQIEVTLWGATRADGHVVDESGRALFRGALPVGDSSELAIGSPLLNPRDADVQLVVRYHGPALPGEIDAQIHELDGGCNPQCVDAQISAHPSPLLVATRPTTVGLISMLDGSEIEAASATLTRSETGVSMRVETSGLEPESAYTVWWVVFNHPENCTGGGCGEDDIFILDAGGNITTDENGGPVFNAAQLEAVAISFLYADGHVVDADGNARFHARLPAKDTGAAVLGPGLLDAMNAEVHLVLRSHGPAIPGLIDEQIYELNGGCNPECIDTQAAVFKPVV